MRLGLLRTLYRILIVTGTALALLILLLGTLRAAAQTNPFASDIKHVSLDIGQNPDELTVSALRPPQQGQITTTGFTNPDIALPADQYPPPELTKPNETPLSDQITELLNSAGKQIGASAASVSIVQIVETNHPEGSTFVYNGQPITFTILITNSGPGLITVTKVVDELPANTLADKVISSPVIITDTVVAGKRQFTWQNIPPIQPGNSFTIMLQSTVVCQADGTVFDNDVAVIYADSDGPINIRTNQTPTTAQVQVTPNGEAVLASEAPTWCSDEDFTLDLDWGDFDHDGDLDLALAASVNGVKVYRNDNGKLTLFSSGNQSRFAAGAFWADINNDDNLELVVLGHDDTAGSAIGGTGRNYVYEPTAGQLTEIQSFDSNRALYRAVFGNFDNDVNDNLDLIAIRFYLLEPGNNDGCNVVLYTNDGAGQARFSLGNSTCLLGDDSWVKSIAAGDYDNDGDLDFAVGGGQTQASSPRNYIYENDGTGTFTPIFFEDFYPAYALDWGDYNGNGQLDLAAGFSGEYQARVYPNNGGQITSTTHIPLNPAGNSVVRGVGWGDLTGNGAVELALGTGLFSNSGFPPIVYEYVPATVDFTPIITMANVFNSFTLWRVRAVDHDNDGDLDLSFSNSDQLGSYFAGGPTLLFTNFAPYLIPTLSPLAASVNSSNVDWGDWNNDGSLDLLFGGGTSLKSKIYLNNNNGGFTQLTEFGFIGPHYGAFGDANGDGLLDIALGTFSENEIYRNNNTGSPFWKSTTSFNTRSLAWVDTDLDNRGRLDLIVGNYGQANTLFLNSGFQSSSSNPIWQSSETDNTRSVAWGYLDSDSFPDFAAGNDGQINRVYQSNGGKSFTLVNWSPTITNDATHSVAWGDYDGDGDMDLAVGNFGQNHIYENQRGSLSQSPVWSSPGSANTSSLAWGDWNNDGQLDLAVGNREGNDQVFANFGSKPGDPKLELLWQSNEIQNTTGVAWGDLDNDGDLDLAISQDGGGQNGVYKNTYVLAAHVGNHRQSMPRFQNPSYLSIAQPGAPGQVLSRTMPITDPDNLSVQFDFTVYDPDVSRANCTSANGDRVQVLKYEYALDGGINWHDANVSDSNAFDPFAARCLGLNRSVTWQAGQDIQANNPNQPVSENARFRITIAHLNKAGPSQRASTAAISPPFRVRNLSCIWPDNAQIIYQPPITPGIPVVLTGTISTGQGQITFNWDFGNVSSQGQIVEHTFPIAGEYPITLTVTGPACPVARESVAIATLTVGLQSGTAGTIFLPVILKSQSGGTTTITSGPETSLETPSPSPESEIGLFVLDNDSGAPTQVKGLQGLQPDAETINLTWNSGPPHDAILGYRVYRSAAGTASFKRLADLPASIANYTDSTATCGQSYFVTAYNASGESLPSTSSYFSLPCP